MIEFKEIELKDFDIYNEFIKDNNLFSCENPFVNLLVWQRAYGNMMALKDGNLFLKSGIGEDTMFRLPLGKDTEKGIEEIFEFCKPQKPSFWICEDEINNGIPEIIKKNYNFNENRNDFDYIYLREDLAQLSGKKYHSKRNHISAFSKKYNWRYEKITKDNIKDILICADKWYHERESDEYLLYEEEGIELILSNMEKLGVIGGAIYVEDIVVAFTLGTALNQDVFVTHIEKALSDYAESYTLINREFAKNELSQFKYINREDDMGIEGVRKAKLSYKPEILLKKYYCTPKSELEIECREIYEEAFGKEDKDFTDALFKNCFKYCKVLRKDGKAVSMLFLLPCELLKENEKQDAYYLFAAATKKTERGKGYMKELIEEIKKDGRTSVFLRPAEKGLIKFYENLGFKTLKAVNSSKGKVQLLPKDEFKLLESFADSPDNTEFDFMSNVENINTISFIYSFD